MDCPTCRAPVRVDDFKIPVYGDPRTGDSSKPEPLRYWQRAECASGHYLILRDGARLEVER